MSKLIHFIVAKCRNGWAVNVESDRLSEHRHAKGARDQAALLTHEAERHGEAARVVDLSRTDDD
jgi:hypothetical protein